MRLSSLADYAVVMMTAAARHCGGAARLNATLLAEETGLPLPTVQKLVSRLSAAGPARERARHRRRLPPRAPAGGDQPRRHRRGGRRADRDDRLRRRRPRTIARSKAHCRVKPHWGVVNGAVRGALAGVSLASSAAAPPCAQPHDDRRMTDGHARTPRRYAAANKTYEWGFSLGHRAGIRAQGAERGHRPLHLGQEERAANGCSTGG